MNIFRLSTIICVSLLVFSCSNAQDNNTQLLTGSWELQGTLLGDDGEGTLLPHNPANADCETDYSVFEEDNTAKEIKYNRSCQANETSFNWELEGNMLTLTKGEKSITWLIRSIDEEKMTVGVQMRPGAEKRMYVVYKKKKQTS